MGIARKLKHDAHVEKFKTIQEYCDYAGISRAAYYERKSKYSHSNKLGPAIYFVYCEGFVKIGYTSWLITRLTELQTGSPHEQRLLHAAVCKTRKVEKKIHSDLVDSHHRGEWFHYCPIVESYIQAIKRLSASKQALTLDNVANIIDLIRNEQ